MNEVRPLFVINPGADDLTVAALVGPAPSFQPRPADRALAAPTLAQNHPKPFNPMTTISFRLPAASRAALSIDDLRGRRIAAVLAGQMAAGEHVVDFDASSQASGTYVYRLEGDDFLLSRKMQLVK